MVLRTVERENGATLFPSLALDVTVQTSLNVGRNEREAIPRRLDQVKEEREFVASHGVLHVPQRTEQRPRRWTPGGTPARRDFQSPALQRHARTARFPIASPSAARPHGAMSIASPSAERPHGAIFNRQPRSGRSSVHEGGRPAERPHGAISNRQPLPRRNARTARCQSPAPPPAERPCGAMSIASPSPSGTPARRDFQSPAPPPAERPCGATSIASPAADRAASTKVDARRNARAARFPIASPSPLTPANHRSPQRTEQRRLTEPHD